MPNVVAAFCIRNLYNINRSLIISFRSRTQVFHEEACRAGEARCLSGDLDTSNKSSSSYSSFRGENNPLIRHINLLKAVAMPLKKLTTQSTNRLRRSSSSTSMPSSHVLFTKKPANNTATNNTILPTFPVGSRFPGTNRSSRVATYGFVTACKAIDGCITEVIMLG